MGNCVYVTVAASGLRGSAARAYSERSIAGGGPWKTPKRADSKSLWWLIGPCVAWGGSGAATAAK